LWLGSLWFVAPLLTGKDSSWASRLRGVAILGIAIPYSLGFLHILYGWTCFAVAGVLLCLRYLHICHAERSDRYKACHPERSERSERSRRTDGAKLALRQAQRDKSRYGPSGADIRFEERVAAALPVLVAVAVGWPALVRPILQGDSLGYHLPNAAAWVHDHSLWTTTTNYWWFPGGSELFASGLLAAAGPLAVGFSGLVGALLLGQRIVIWGIETGTRPWIAGAVAAMTLSALGLAEQAGSLENDVWLAAFFLEALWLLRHHVTLSEAPKARSRSADGAYAIASSAAVTALLKPTGWLYALLALVLGRVPLRIVGLALLPLILWLLRDTILIHDAIISPMNSSFPHPFQTTIAAHGGDGIVTLARALIGNGAASALLFGAGVASIAFAGDRRLRVAAFAALIVFFLHPFGFNDDNPQLATGTSLRYAAPFFALGALFVSELASRGALALGGLVQIAIGTLALIVAGFGVGRVADVYWKDAMTHGTFAVIVVMAIALILPMRVDRLRLATTSASAAFVAYAVVLAGSHPLDYYEDWLGGPTVHSNFFHWLARAQPQAIVGYGLRVGSISAVSPATRAIDAIREDPCGEARRLDALLAIANDAPGPPPGRTAHLRIARHCGATVFDDGATIVVNPAAPASRSNGRVPG